MKLRELKISDAPLMLDWMHDEDVVKDLKKDFKSMAIYDFCVSDMRVLSCYYFSLIHLRCISVSPKPIGNATAIETRKSTKPLPA